MSNKERYDKIFFDVFGVNEDRLHEISFKGTPEWDSVGHMGLIARIEDEFDILIEAEDLFGLRTYNIGKNILKKYGIEI